MSLGKLKDHERLLIWRIRLDLTQARAAKRLRMTPARYAKMELGREPIILAVNSFGVPMFHAKASSLECHERCLLYRRRAGKSQAAVAKGIKLSRYWVNRMERGQAPCDTLLWYWEQ